VIKPDAAVARRLDSGPAEDRLRRSHGRHSLGYRLQRFSVQGVLLLVIALVGITMIIPFYWMFVTSFKNDPEIFTIPIKWWPSKITFKQYEAVFHAAPFGRYLANSFVVSSVCVTTSLFFATMTGYAFAKFRVRGANLIFIIILSGLMVPFSVRLIPMYIMMTRVHLNDTLLGVMGPNLLSILGIFLMRQYITALPDDLADFARIDGASEFRILVRIIMPLSMPAMSALGIFKFMFTWNDFIWPLVLLNDVNKRTVTVGLAMFSGFYTTYYGQFMAASVVSVIPILVVYLFFQRQIIQGIALTGLKG
jgi:multiple sugar transport system permease protein